MKPHGNPPALQRAIDRQLQRLQRGRVEDEPVQSRRAPLAAKRPDCAWARLVARVNQRMETSHGVQEIWIPGLELRSANRAIACPRSRSGGIGGSSVGLVEFKRIATREARRAIQAALGEGAAWKRVGYERAYVRILQFGTKQRIDARNLWDKALLDCLTERGHGIAVFRDDAPRYIIEASSGYPPGDESRVVGVLLVISPTR